MTLTPSTLATLRTIIDPSTIHELIPIDEPIAATPAPPSTPTLFDTIQPLAPFEHTTCQYPMVAGDSGYRYGCRCWRCTDAHRNRPKPLPTCHVEGCDGARLKQRKVCLDHLPRCAHPDCSSPRRLVQAAKYCEEHATSKDGQFKGGWFTNQCFMCGVDVERRQLTACAVCAEHQHLRPLVRAWRTHHVTTELAQAWMADPRCWICEGDLSWRFHPYARADGGVHVDHDHGHCKGEHSCGRCIRGLSHARCNQQTGFLDKLLESIGPARLVEVVACLIRKDYASNMHGDA